MSFGIPFGLAGICGDKKGPKKNTENEQKKCGNVTRVINTTLFANWRFFFGMLVRRGFRLFALSVCVRVRWFCVICVDVYISKSDVHYLLWKSMIRTNTNHIAFWFVQTHSPKTGNQLWFSAWRSVGYNRKRWSHHIVFAHTEGQNIRFREIHMFADTRKSEHRQCPRPKWYVCESIRYFIGLSSSSSSKSSQNSTHLYIWTYAIFFPSSVHRDAW